MSLKGDHDNVLLPAHAGIGSNDPYAGRPRPNPTGPTFINDHQLPTNAEDEPVLAPKRGTFEELSDRPGDRKFPKGFFKGM